MEAILGEDGGVRLIGGGTQRKDRNQVARQGPGLGTGVEQSRQDPVFAERVLSQPDLPGRQTLCEQTSEFSESQHRGLSQLCPRGVRAC